MFCAQYLQDHVVHFYHLHALDWVDVVSALKADPKKTSELAQSISNWPKSSPGYFARPAEAAHGVRRERPARHLRQRLLGPLRPTSCPPEVNLMAVAHYLEALEWQKEIVKVHTIFGGKNPHPNYLVGGVPCSFNLDEANAINAERLALRRQAVRRRRSTFVEQVYIPDLLAVASLLQGLGRDRRRPEELHGLRRPADATATATRREFKFPRGVILNRNLNEVLPVDGKDPEQVQEFDRALLVRVLRTATTRRCTRGTARRSSTTPGRSRPTSSSTWSRSTAG